MMETTIQASGQRDLCLSPRKGKVRMFDCTICGESLEQQGPSLEAFSFGRLLLAINQLSFSEQEVIYREFSIFDQCFSNGFYDCSKVLSTACGHLFHSGCMREWFFMRRLDRIKKCPYCNQRTNYDECWVIHPTACGSDEVEDDDEPALLPIQKDEDTDDKHAQPTNAATTPVYSDISGASSSFSSDVDGSDSEETEVEEHANEQDETMLMNASSSSTENEEGTNFTLTDDDDSLQGAEMEADSQTDAPLQTDPFSSNKNNNDTEYGIIRKVLRFIDKFNIHHTLLLCSTIRSVCYCYQTRKARFLNSLDYVDDEDLAEEETRMIPLGYDFIGQLLTTALIIWFIEKVRNIFTNN